ncbi:MAG: Bug family tripartite tricarboxylate transporter substrate binding protein, partial [Burkholderiaceae bacterium]
MNSSTSKFSFDRRALLTAAAAVAMAPGLARAAFADRPVKLVMGFPPGSAPDVVGRLFGVQLSAFLGQPVVVDNRPGAAAQIAANVVAKSPADGYTLLLAEAGSMLVAPLTTPKLPYNPGRELRIIAKLTDTPFVFVTSADGPRTMAAFLERAKSTDRVNIAALGRGTGPHLLAEKLAAQLGFRIQPLYYRNMGDWLTGLLNGDALGAFIAPSSAVPHIQSGKLRALATTNPGRLELLPEVPTFAEQGIQNFEFTAWLSIFAPAGTPQAVVDRIGEGLAQGGKDEGLLGKMRMTGTSAQVLTAGEAVGFL